MTTLDLTPFGFTPTESLVYEVLLREGPGTGYGIARAAGLARANAYAALEGLVAKGAARVRPDEKPRRFRPEPPETLLARILDHQARDVDQLRQSLDSVALPPGEALVEIHSGRSAIQLLAHDIARAQDLVALFLPAEAWPLLGPALRKAAGGGVTLRLCALRPVTLDVAPVSVTPPPPSWPGEPVLAVIDRRVALLASRTGDVVSGHWGTAPTLVAATSALIP